MYAIEDNGKQDGFHFYQETGKTYKIQLKGFTSMKKYIILLLLIALCSLVFSGCATEKNSNKSKENSNEVADLIFKNGDVYTVNKNRSWANAVAVKDGKIVYVGNNKGVASFKGTRTRVIDLKGKMLMPGFIDSHNHAYLMAESLFWLSLNPYPTVEKRQQAIKDYVKKHPNMKQLRGVGWDEINRDSKSRGLAPKELLDQVVPDIPAVFIANSHHSILVNSKALEMAGIDKNTPDPQGGTIERDPKTGDPTGILHEFSAENLVIKALPQPDFTVEQFKKTLLAWQKTAAEDGITSVFVPVHYPTENLLKAFKELDHSGKLTVRYDLGLWADENKGTEQIDQLKKLRDQYQGKLYKIDSIKIFADGVGENKLVWNQNVLEKTVAALDKEGFRIYVHAIGNQGFYPSHNVLNAFEYAAKVNGERDSRHVITHLDWVKEEDVPRFKDLGVIPAPQPAWFGKDWYDHIKGEKLKEVNHMNSYFKAGIPVVSSSDFPSTNTFKRDMYPLTGLEVGITRLDPDHTTEADLNKVEWPKEKASLQDMIASYTINGAHLIFQENERGSIEVGKKADLVVLDKNLFKIPVTTIGEVKVLLTMFEGKEVFQHPAFTGMPN